MIRFEHEPAAAPIVRPLNSLQSHLAVDSHHTSFIMPQIQLPELPDLTADLQRLIEQVPAGRVTTYGDLARGLGNVIASRWIGSFLLHDPRAEDWPTHRVIRADGSLGLYGMGSVDDKAKRLTAEGVEISAGKVELKRFGVNNFTSSQPLRELQALQERIPQQCSLQPPENIPRTVAGMDVSYTAGDIGIGGYALVDVASGELIWSTTLRCVVSFPYISTYLSFRELPVLAALLEAASEAGFPADSYMIDGAGIMHPRRAGIATHFGVAANLPTMGVTKKMLVGAFRSENMKIDDPREVEHQDETLGVALRPRLSSKKLIWVSPGHRMNVHVACALARRLLRGRHLPEPIYWADRLSRQETKR